MVICDASVFPTSNTRSFSITNPHRFARHPGIVRYLACLWKLSTKLVKSTRERSRSPGWILTTLVSDPPTEPPLASV